MNLEEKKKKILKFIIDNFGNEYNYSYSTHTIILKPIEPKDKKEKNEEYIYFNNKKNTFYVNCSKKIAKKILEIKKSNINEDMLKEFIEKYYNLGNSYGLFSKYVYSTINKNKKSSDNYINIVAKIYFSISNKKYSNLNLKYVFDPDLNLEFELLMPIQPQRKEYFYLKNENADLNIKTNLEKLNKRFDNYMFKLLKEKFPEVNKNMEPEKYSYYMSLLKMLII